MFQISLNQEVKVKKAKGKIVRVIIDKKVWEVSRQMANAMIEIAKQKYMKENVNAIVAVEKEGTIAMQKDVFDKTDAFVKAIQNWERSGYRCYFTTKKG